MNITFSFQIILALLFVNDFCEGHKDTFEPLGKEELELFRCSIQVAYEKLMDIIEASHSRETQNKPITKQNVAASYYISKFPTVEDDNEQWYYFVANYLNEFIKDHQLNIVFRWEPYFGEKVLQAYVDVVNKGKFNMDKISVKNIHNRYRVYKMLYNLAFEKLKMNRKSATYMANCESGFKKVGILLMMEGVYKKVTVSLGGPNYFSVRLDVFSHAEMISKYTADGSAKGIIMTYCELHKAYQLNDSLCSEIEKNSTLNKLFIKRIYYKLVIEPDMWANVAIQIGDKTDYLNLLSNLKFYMEKQKKKRKANSILADENLKVLDLLETLSNERYDYDILPLSRDTVKNIFNDSYFKHESVVVFSKNERINTAEQISNSVKLLMEYFQIQTTFKVIILRSSLIVKVKNVQGGSVKAGLDAFSLDNCRLDNLEKWGYIKTYFMKKAIISGGQTYYNALETAVISELADLYSALEGKNVKTLYQGLSYYRNRFIDDILWKLYVYQYKLESEGSRPNLVKFSFIPNYLKVHIIIKKSHAFNINIKFIEFDFDYVKLAKSTYWIRYIDSFSTHFPKVIQEKYKEDGWVIKNLIIRFKTLEVLLAEKLIFDYLSIPKDSRYQYNRRFLKSLLNIFLNFIFSKRANYFDKERKAKISFATNIREAIKDRYEALFGVLPVPLLEIDIIKSNMLGIRPMKPPQWFQNAIFNKNIQLSMESIPALFFREFQVYEKYMGTIK